MHPSLGTHIPEPLKGVEGHSPRASKQEALRGLKCTKQSSEALQLSG